MLAVTSFGIWLQLGSSFAAGIGPQATAVARAVNLLLHTDAKTIAGRSYNCRDVYVAEQEVARIAQELVGSKAEIADLNRGPKNQIDTSKLRGLGMTFGGQELLRRTVTELVEAHTATTANQP